MGKHIYVIGIGPGNQEYMTQEARAALESSDVIVGYTAYA
ncbi:MAG: precorrin-3B C(17)-methyltransferase, partial [Lachnospiraceae bacterium]|nr:precorrin-3B C(17)-methyltransferase [Lachnospiraceae bacterium]